MSFFTQASFVMDPNVYGVGKLYVPKPTDGSGDLTFTRASNGTRVNQDGLIEKVRTNEVKYSEQFDNALWIKSIGVVVTPNATTAPDGTSTADYIEMGAASRIVSQNTSIATGATSTFSVWIKGTNGETIKIAAGGVDSPTITLNGQWQRISFTAVGINSSVNINTFGGATARNFYLWGAQAELSDFGPTDYIPTTTSAVSVGPLANIPRLNYGADGCPSLLLEPQRTNSALYSEQFDNAAWGKTGGATVTANDTISPDGYQNADRFNMTSNDTIAQGVSVSGEHTFSVWLKGTAGETIGIGCLVASGTFVEEQKTLTTDWQRYTLTATFASTGTRQIYLSTYAGATARTLWAWGAQLEANSYATSYIPTLSSAVTRVVDEASKTGISSLIGQTEGTLFAEVQLEVKPESGSPVVGILTTNNNVADLQNCIILGVERNSSGINKIYCLVQVSNVTQAALFGPSIASGTYKIALAYKANDFALYVNGVQVATDASGSVPTTSQVLIGTRRNADNFTLADRVSQALLFKTRLTNADLARLTSL